MPARIKKAIQSSRLIRDGWFETEMAAPARRSFEKRSASQGSENELGDFFESIEHAHALHRYRFQFRRREGI